MISDDIIAALSTPYGRGGIAVIRVTGEGSIALCEKVFRPRSGKALSEYRSSAAVYGDIYDKSGLIDDGLATVFRAPKSFTGEETVEISCHGGIILCQTVLEAIFAAGARQAGPGEYTKRAFLNGHISLSQAESVMDLIDAESKEKVHLAAAQSHGVLSGKIDSIAGKITDLLSEAYVRSDYPDEDLNDMTSEKLGYELGEVIEDMKKLSDTYGIGSAVCEGVPTVIAGKPNTGKSSLLNAILGTDRAIVTDVPGTTRDTIDATVNIGRIFLRISDTAGIRGTSDTVEKLGVERTEKLIKELGKNGLVLAVFDGSKDEDDQDGEFISFLAANARGQIIPILNKSDIGTDGKYVFPAAFGTPVRISAKKGEGIDALRDAITSLFVSEAIDYGQTPVISNARQHACLTASLETLENARDALGSGTPMDMVLLDVEQAHSSLCEIDGRGTAEEITDKIFHRFCVGK